MILCVVYMNIIKTALGIPNSHYWPSTWIHVCDGDAGRFSRQRLADLFVLQWAGQETLAASQADSLQPSFSALQLQHPAATAHM